MVYRINGLPARSARFFLGMPLEPPRAGITPRIVPCPLLFANCDAESSDEFDWSDGAQTGDLRVSNARPGAGPSLAVAMKFWQGDLGPLTYIIVKGERRWKPKHRAMLLTAGGVGV